VVDEVGVLMKVFSRILALLAALVAFVAVAPAGAAASSREAVVTFAGGVSPAAQAAAVRAAGGQVVRDLHVINGLGVRIGAGGARRLARSADVRTLTPNVRMRPTAAPVGDRWGTWNPTALATSFVQSTGADKAWTDPRLHATGAGVNVAVVDTGVDGDLPDFRTSGTDPTSRVIASAVANPDATTAADLYGHGTHVAGLIAGNGRALPTSDPLYNRYIGTAPQAGLVSVKVSDDDGNASIMDVIAGLQFVVDHRADYGIRVVNLSLGAATALPYRVDPLDAAVEAAWAHGIVVVVAAGNYGTSTDAVSYAPANDPYVITVGAVDDHATKNPADDTLAPWSSRGLTQDGFAKPDLVAPGAHIVGPLAPGSRFLELCPNCLVDGRYFRVGGTSMAAPIVSGIVADLLSAHPTWTPDQVKGALTYLSPKLDASGEPISNMRLTADGAWEIAAYTALHASSDELVSNTGLAPSIWLDPATGDIDWSRMSWKRASWKAAADGLRASWGAASWSCDCAAGTDDPVAQSTRASWGRASWKTFFGESPADFGELAGGESGRVPPGQARG
jgi:serine protease AprX